MKRVIYAILAFCASLIGSSAEGIDIIRPVLDATDVTHFLNVPSSYTSNKALFDAIWARTTTEPIRIAMFGDSQETAPGGQGSIYIPRLNYELYRRFGKVSETMVTSCGGFGGGVPYGAWLHTGHTAPPGPSASRVDSTYLLPGLCSLTHSTKNLATNINGQAYGQLYVLRHNGARLNPNALIDETKEYFCLGTNIRAQIIASTYPGSGELRYRGAPTNNATSGDFFAPTTVTQQMLLGLDETAYTMKSGTTDLLPLGSFAYHQIEINGDTDSKLTSLIGARLISESCNQGAVIQPLAAGGYMVSHMLTNHTNAGPLFRHLAFDMAMIHLGTNDANNSVTAEQHYTQMLQLIAQIRTWQGDPTFPVILFGEIYHYGMTAAEMIQDDKFAHALYRIALHDPYVKFVNSRRLAYLDGFDPLQAGAISQWLIDIVHYTPYGARRLAELEMQELLDRR